MKKLIKSILKNTLLRSAGIYTITNVLNKAIPFLLLPILTRYLTPEDYGIVAMFGVIVSFSTPFIGLNTHGAIARMYYDRDTVDIKAYVTNCLLILLVSTAMVSVVFYLFAEIIVKYAAVPSHTLWMVVALASGGFISTTVLTLWQVQVKPVQYGIFLISKTLLNAGLSIVLVVFLGMNWQGRIEAQLYTMAVFVIISALVLWKNGWFRFSFRWDYIKKALNFGVPLVPHTIAGIIMTMTDRFFITAMVGLAATGIYSIGYQVGNLIGLIEESFNKAYVPWLYGKLKGGEERDKYKIVRFTYIYFGIIILMALALSVIAPWFLSFYVGKEFSGSVVFIIWIAMSYAFNGMYKMVGTYIFYAQKTKILAWVTLSTACLNLVLNYFMISANGAIGAAQATLITYIVKFFLVWLLSNKVYKMPWFKKPDFIGENDG